MKKFAFVVVSLLLATPASAQFTTGSGGCADSESSTCVSATPHFVVGGVYQGPYPSQRFIVVSTSMAMNGDLIVTAEWLTPGWNTPEGGVIAFRVPRVRPEGPTGYGPEYFRRVQ